MAGVNFNVIPVSDRINLSPGDVVAAGFEVGARGRVLTLAALAADLGDAPRLCLTCIADADRAFVRNDLPHSDVLLVTDFGSLECYALTPRVLSKFVAVVLRQREPDGASLLAALEPLLIAVFLARAALHISGVGYGLDADDIKKHKFDQPGLEKSLLKRALPQGQGGQPLYDQAHSVLATIRTELPSGEPRKAIRGHDIAPVMIAHMGLNNDFAHPETVEKSLMACVERADLQDFPLFRNLVARVASAKTG